MTPEQERWAEALAVLRMHGTEAEAFVAKRIETLAGARDTAGVARWQAIAARMRQVREAEQRPLPQA